MDAAPIFIIKDFSLMTSSNSVASTKRQLATSLMAVLFVIANIIKEHVIEVKNKEQRILYEIEEERLKKSSYLKVWSNRWKNGKILYTST